MIILRFDANTGKAIERFNSSGALVTRLHTSTQMSAVCMHITAGGVVGYHQATTNQLFLVVAGLGWVRGEADERHPIRSGQAAFWHPGEGHESGSDTGMTVIVLEGDNLHPDQFLEEVTDGS